MAQPHAHAKPHFTILVVEPARLGTRTTKAAIAEGAGREAIHQNTLVVRSVERALAELSARGSSYDAVVLATALDAEAHYQALNAICAIDTRIAVLTIVEKFVAESAIEALRCGATGVVSQSDIDNDGLWRSVRLAIERKQNESELQALSQTDPLTGLSNRRAFDHALERAIEQARRTTRCFAVLLLDVNEFKGINDIYGHLVGDQILRHIANCLSNGLRRTDVVARVGGDEFAVIACNLSSISDALEIADKLKSCIESPGAVEGYALQPSVSIGISVFDDPREDAATLVGQADMAMYKSKRDPGHGVFYYDEKMHRDATHRHLIKKKITSCSLSQSLYLDFQPIVAASDAAIVGAEGLARWRDGKNKVIVPGEFIPIAEECGWISALGAHLIDEACRFMRDMKQSGIPSVPISVNVSPIQCREPGFALELTGALLQYGIEPSAVAVEITETALMSNIDVARRCLETLKDAGVGIHIDDFGTGYSSLSLLKDLPLTRLKIDKEFVADIGANERDLRIVEVFVELGAKLGFEVVAEGVETAEQADLLRGIGVNYLQGYYFSRPVGGDRLREMLVAGRPLLGAA
ncbi:bifunctional diguanylate cyclase/phosphodiesterase [Oricola sp.]|uniref:putative bifunctional diguanylate cyclase/phosphodiesterase n=1 Tax=Oricola sp. TaxID=1979950 RepID=UPI0025CD4644|nr:bifunctional diguanylate cyclase/phosphodiesterase [Oricola sp.]MCI5076416.1 bifunctional diguanylate cyclase/phosphodiesterase [Oricola sp.]